MEEECGLKEHSQGAQSQHIMIIYVLQHLLSVISIMALWQLMHLGTPTCRLYLKSIRVLKLPLEQQA